MATAMSTKTPTVLPSILNLLSDGVDVSTIDRYGYPTLHNLLELDKESLKKLLSTNVGIKYATRRRRDRERLCRDIEKKQDRSTIDVWTTSPMVDRMVKVAIFKDTTS